MEKEEFDKKKKWISERGYTTRLIERKIETVNHSDVVEIEKEKELEEENKKNQNQNENEYEQEENNMEEEENEDNEHQYFQSNQNNFLFKIPKIGSIEEFHNAPSYPS